MKIRKQFSTSIVISILIVFFCSCFVDRINNHYHIPFKNNANHSIFVFRESKEQYLALPHFQDTILQSYYPDPCADTVNYKIHPGEESINAIWQMGTFEYDFGYAFDTLLVFIFNADTLEMLGWDTVRAYYKVEQRYDFSLEDLKSVGFKITFPPTESMKHIHMWPPYGTYDEHGRRKDENQ